MIRNRLTLAGLATLVAVAACQATTQEPAAAAPAPAPAAPAAAAPAPAAGAASDIWAGVYTTAQATRGQRVVTQVCSACHSPSEWSRPDFLRGWSNRPVADLFDQIHSTMPMNAPGSLTRQQYVDVITYMLQINKVPAGQVELGTTDEALRAVRIQFPRS